MHNKNISPYSTQNQNTRDLNEAELKTELERLEKELADGKMSVADSLRLKSVRKHLRELGDLKLDSMT